MDIQKNIESWRHDFIAWQKVFFPDLVWKKPQLEASIALSKIVSAKIKKFEKLPLTKEDKEYVNKRGISIMSAQGVGKGFWVSIVIWWAMTVFYKPHLVVTSSTDKQLKNTLWSRVAEMRGKSNTFGGGVPFLEQAFVMNSEKIYQPEFNGLEWFTETVVAGNDAKSSNAVSAAGRHNKVQFFIFDEASDQPNSFFETIEGTMSDPISIAILLFNPTTNVGYAIDTQTKFKSQWVALQWSGIGALDEDHINAAREKYGEDSNFYRVRILGLPPVNDTNSLIPYEWVRRAIVKSAKHPEGKELIKYSVKPRRIGALDVGGGKDPSAIYLREGANPINVKTWSFEDYSLLVDAVINYIYRWEVDMLLIDSVGIGGPVYSQLKRSQFIRNKVMFCDVRNKSTSLSYYQKRDQIAWRIRELLQEGLIILPDNDQLFSQLTSIRYHTLDSGKIKIESKDEMAARNMPSPNEFDALVMCYSITDLVVDSAQDKSYEVQEKSTAFRKLFMQEINSAGTEWMQF